MKDNSNAGLFQFGTPQDLIPWWYAGTPTMFFDEHPDLKDVAKNGGNIYDALDKKKHDYVKQRMINTWVVNEHGC